MPTIAPVNTGEAPSHVEWAGFLADVPAFALSEGRVVFAHGGEKSVHLGSGLNSCVAAADGLHLVCGLENGAVVSVDGDREISALRVANGKWIDAIAAGPSGLFAIASGKNVEIHGPAGLVRGFSAPRTAEALAFAPKGLRLAVARYNGVDLYWASNDASPQALEWKGAHNKVTFSPDGKYVVTAMQENALHGWRLADGKHMRMSGYPAKVKSLSWSAKGAWLASTGAPASITWPFTGKDGPMGKPPKELGALGEVMATQVACHPAEDVVAIGYGDGTILGVRITDGKEAGFRRGGGAAISALNWDRQGRRLAYGTEGGDAGIVDIAG